MHPIIVRCLVIQLLCVSGLVAQSHVTSPPGYQTTEGTGSTGVFGRWFSSRYMLFDGELRNAPMMVKATAFRLDHNSFNTVVANRSWPNVTLRMSDCDVNKLSLNFADNPLSTPTLVFSGSVTWPVKRGFPSSKAPAPWGGPNGEYVFPFSTSWNYSGKHDICLDYAFSLGTNSSNQMYINLDSFDRTSNSGTRIVLGRGCRDSAHTRDGSLGTVISGISSPTSGRTHVVTTSSTFTAPSKPVVHGYFFGGVTAGITFPGVSCVRLYPDPAKTILFKHLLAGPQGSASDRIRLAYDPTIVGMRLWTQAGWGDSVSSTFRMTNATRVIWPAVPRIFKRWSLWNRMGYTYSNYIYYGNAYNPLIRYTK